MGLPFREMWPVIKRGDSTKGHILPHHAPCVFKGGASRVQLENNTRQNEKCRSQLSFPRPNKEVVFERQSTLHLLALVGQLWSPAPTCSGSSGRKYESGRVSLASCPLMAHPITRTWALHRTCAQETWRYSCYTTETGYALFTNLGSLSCPQPLSHYYEGDERRAQKKVWALIYSGPNTDGQLLRLQGQHLVDNRLHGGLWRFPKSS